MNKLQLLEEAKARVKSLDFGQPVTNVCAGHPARRHSYFCELVVKSTTNRWKVEHKQYFARCTDLKGNFWNTGIEVVYPGHLSDSESEGVFAEVHKVLYG